jgi:choline dehydrogenase-like flavoprotein
MRDVIVVGAGGGGAIVAKELAVRGLDVLLLEAGHRFARSEREWRHFENDVNNPATGIFRFGPGDRSKPPWARDLPQNCYVWQTAGVGGSTVHYFANSPRAMPGVFADYAGDDLQLYDRDHVFPFGYAELVPYYEWVEHTLPVQTAAMGRKEEVFLHSAGKLGLPVQTSKDITRAAYRPQENAILQPKGTAGRTPDRRRLFYPTAQGCTFCGHCIQGCVEPIHSPANLRAKRSTHASYVPMALTADRWAHGKAVTLVPDAFAVRIETARQGSTTIATGVTWRGVATGETATEPSKVVVLAAGAVETPRLWLNSRLPNPNDQVGRGLTNHYYDYVIGRLPIRTNSSKGPASAARADFPGYGGLESIGLPPALQAQSLTASDAGIAGFYNNGFAGGTQGADAVGRLVGNRLKRFLRDIDHLLAAFVITDDDVQAASRVTLSTTMTPDEHGPIARIELPRPSARTTRNREFLVRQTVELLRAAGAREVVRLNWPPLLVHIHSTTRMGVSDRDSVLDENAEARWVKRLFVADNSALANALGGPNPTLTTQALATRTAEKIFERYFGGESWVRHEAPVASIDPAVTQAVAQLPPSGEEGHSADDLELDRSELSG